MRTFIAIALLMSAAAFGQSDEYNGSPSRPRGVLLTDQIIVKWRASASAASIGAKLAEVSAALEARLQRKQSIASGIDVLKLERRLGRDELTSLLARLNARPEIEYAVADQWRYAHALPADPLIAEQWYFLAEQPSATRAEQAWDATTGSSATVVAVLDTGVRFEHPDLGRVESGGKLLPGFDFVSDIAVANDGDGRDGDPSDPGDWVSAAEALQPPFDASNCIPAGSSHVDSTWHGTRVAGLIGALTNNAVGVAGAGWNTLLLPVRVLGKCGGFDSDIITAMRWAAGLPVSGAPPNLNPAKIINMSLGGDGACSLAQQSAVNEIMARGVLIIASVGNEGGPVGAPANCNGVLAVAGLRHVGTKVGFSNLGPDVALGAPGGNCVNTGSGQPCLFSIIVAKDAGATTPTAPTYSDHINANYGTSFSAPLVAGAAALMHSVNAQLSPAHYRSILRETAALFPTSSATTTSVCRTPTGPADIQNLECICTTQTCGAGMLNTHAAVLAAQRPLAVVQAPGIIEAGVDIALDGGSSVAANARSIGAYQWSTVNVTGATPSIADPAQARTNLQVSGASQFTLRLTVTDDQGAFDTADVAMATPSAPPPPPPVQNPPPAQSNARSGGGDVGLAMLALLSWLTLAKALLRRVQLRRQIP
ncbi:MAG: S8 family serine peptidase [Steroidobacter sp.]